MIIILLIVCCFLLTVAIYFLIEVLKVGKSLSALLVSDKAVVVEGDYLVYRGFVYTKLPSCPPDKHVIEKLAEDMEAYNKLKRDIDNLIKTSKKLKKSEDELLSN